MALRCFWRLDRSLRLPDGVQAIASSLLHSSSKSASLQRTSAVQRRSRTKTTYWMQGRKPIRETIMIMQEPTWAFGQPKLPQERRRHIVWAAKRSTSSKSTLASSFLASTQSKRHKQVSPTPAAAMQSGQTSLVVKVRSVISFTTSRHRPQRSCPRVVRFGWTC